MTTLLTFLGISVATIILNLFFYQKGFKKGKNMLIVSNKQNLITADGKFITPAPE